jgi:DNA-binding transcriptional ArsR family regulator
MNMRPLFHPAPEDITVEGILYSLSDPVRASIFFDIARQQCTQNCSSFLTVRDKAIPKSTLSQYMRILRENGLIRGERRGVEMRITSRCQDLNQRFPGLIPAILSAHDAQSSEDRKSRPRAKQSSRKVRK